MDNKSMKPPATALSAVKLAAHHKNTEGCNDNAPQIQAGVDTSVKISAIVCTHNRSDLLPKAIDSLMSQTLTASEYEIIVVDNASTDGTKSVCEGYLSQTNFRYIYESVPGLSVARNRGLAEAKGKYVAYMDDDALASTQWLELLLNVFASIQPTPVSVGGKIHPIWEVEKPDWFPDVKKPYLTILDYGDEAMFLTYPKILYGTNMAFSKQALVDAGGFRTDVGRKKYCLLSGEEMEVYRQLSEKALPVYYAPTASVQHLVPKNRLTKSWLYSRHYWQGRTEALVLPEGMEKCALKLEMDVSIKRAKEHIRELWRSIFNPVDRSFRFLHTASLLQCLGRIQQLFIKLRDPLQTTSSRQRMLVIARSLPRFDRGSGHLRLFSIIEILASKFQIDFISENFSSTSDCDDMVYVNSLKDIGVDFHRINNLKQVINKIHDVVFFEFYDTAERHYDEVKRLNDTCRVIIDSVDVHFAREIAMAKVLNDDALMKKAHETRTKEISVYRKADAVWAVTPEDKEYLLAEQLDTPVDIIPNIHKIEDFDRSKPEINTILFIGNFWHQPNEDAVVYFATEILPLLTVKIPDIVFKVVGNAPTDKIKRLASKNLDVVGWVPETRPYLEKCHISVVPLRYGAGMKGKVGEAMNAGIPLVTSSIGIQGMDVRDHEEVLVADNPSDFAAAVVQLLKDGNLAIRLSENAKAFIRQRYNPEAVSGSIINAVTHVLEMPSKKSEMTKPIFESKNGRYTFQADPESWLPCEGVDIQVSNDNSLKFEGIAPKDTWSFAQTKSVGLQGGKRYSINGLIMVENLDNATTFLKLELYKNGQWLKNIVSNYYKIEELGIWQKMSGDFIAPTEDALELKIAIEKRPYEQKVRGKIFVKSLEIVIY